VAYTGTHDNDTVCGWWKSKPGKGSIRTEDDINKEREFARAYLAFESDDVNWVFIRALMASVAETVIFPLQDVLGLGSEARMNIPGTATGNWGWRAHGEALITDITDRLRKMAEIYDRR
jgi:4-alpha-glucanotransferase